MRAIFHPRVYSDLAKIMGYYERVATPELAQAFSQEFRHFVEGAIERPTTFPVRERDIRRADLRRFPYHVLFRIVGESVRILVVRHHRRHPSLGMTVARRRCRPSPAASTKNSSPTRLKSRNGTKGV